MLTFLCRFFCLGRASRPPGRAAEPLAENRGRAAARSASAGTRPNPRAGLVKCLFGFLFGFLFGLLLFGRFLNSEFLFGFLFGFLVLIYDQK